MNQNEARSLPYKHLVQTAEWSVLDRALLQLTENHDLVETTQHEYIVGYLCKALVDKHTQKTTAQEDSFLSSEDRIAALRGIRESVRAANPARRDLVSELIAERRLEANHE